MAARRSNEQIVSDLITEGAELLSEAFDLGQSLTDTYRKLANVIVDLRKRFTNSKGQPDWKGTSQEYRTAVATMYEQSGIPTDSVSNMQAAIRYHIGNVLRERLTEKELADAGLAKDGPLDRARASRSSSGGDAPENDQEWFEDTVETLKSVADEHPDVLIIDLRDEGDDVDPVPLVRQALGLLQRAAERGVDEGNASAVSATLDQVIAEAAAFRAEVHAVTAAAPPQRARAGAGRR